MTPPKSRKTPPDEWKSTEHTAEECITIFGFDPHEGHRDQDGRAHPMESVMSWERLSFRNTNFAPPRPKKRKR